MDGKEILEINEKLKKIIDPNNEYSYENFLNEYSNSVETLNQVNTTQFSVDVKFVNKSNNLNPEYATPGSAGFDLRSNANLTIQPGQFEKVPTGLYFELPNNFEMQVRPRSGLAAKNGVTVLNSPGTIDSDYRGEIIVILINHGKEPFKIEVGDRIAQAVIAQTCTSFINLTKVDEISDNTERSSGGFGSTGLK